MNMKEKVQWCLDRYRSGDRFGVVCQKAEDCKYDILFTFLLRTGMYMTETQVKTSEVAIVDAMGYASEEHEIVYCSNPTAFLRKCEELTSVRVSQHEGMKEYVVYDLETTGFTADSSCIIEIGALKVKDGQIVDTFSELIKPPYRIPYNIVTMTGITDEMVKDCRSVKEVVPEFVDWVGDLPLLGHNLPFDYRFMVCVCKSLGIDFTLGGTRRGIDTLSLCRNLYSFVSNKLGDVVSQMHIQLNGAQYHRATFDANATKEVYEVIVRDYGSMTRVNTPILLKNKNEKTAEVGECESLSFS